MRTMTLVMAMVLCPMVVQAAEPPARETSCTDGQDEDGDGLADCGDADCAQDPACKPDGEPENTDARCSDWIDNDEDGHVDCHDRDCEGPTVTHCRGSWKGPLEAPQIGGMGNAPPDDEMPQLAPGQTMEDLIGTGSDKDGERNDIDCSDGIDNDGDGRTDCADFGCRFDPTVRVCQGQPGMRFSIVANIGASYDFLAETAGESVDVNFSKLQLRSFGPIPYVQDSFYLLSMRAERQPRLTFAMFKVPIARGHFVNVNSGSGGLSKETVLSSAKHLLLSPPFYLTSAFEQRNSAAVEFTGPLTRSGRFRYSAFLAGGSGVSNGNVGGRFFEFDFTNFHWSVGATVRADILGRTSSWDSQFMYGFAPPTVSFGVGARYDERAQERFVVGQGTLSLRWNRFAFAAQSYYKREFAFGSDQVSYNLRAGVLIWPKWLMLGADWGEFLPGDPDKEPETKDLDLRRQLGEGQWRVAMHLYWYRNVGVATLIYADREVEPSDPDQEDPDRERRLRLVVQYRF